MLKKRPSKLYFSLSRFGKDILGKKLQVFFKTGLKTCQFGTKTDLSSIQSTDIVKTPSTLNKWKNVNCPSYSNFGINSRSWKKASTAITYKPFGL